MPRYPRWDREELLLLAGLYHREGAEPKQESLTRLRQLLVVRGRLWTESAFDPSFRSEASIRNQLWRYSLLESESPRAADETSQLMRDVWLELAERPEARLRHADHLASTLAPLLDTREEELAPFGVDRIALRGFLADLRLLLEEMLERGEEFVGYDALEDLRDAWAVIERERLFDDALTRILSPEMDQRLRAVGLVDAPRTLKTNGFSRAYRGLLRQVGRWTWPDVKPVLKWANVILGSLARTMTSIDPLKEFKEAWEVAAEEAYE